MLGVEKILDRPSCYLIWLSELTDLLNRVGELFLRTPGNRLCNIMQFEKLRHFTFHLSTLEGYMLACLHRCIVAPGK